MEAQTLNCFSCGAPVSSDSPTCEHCGARLATISCPACFGMMFIGSKFCPHCGAAAAQWQSTPSKMPCPSCQAPMLQGALETINLHQCGKCFGLWLEISAFQQICRNSEQQAAVLGIASPESPQNRALTPVRYRRCPQCRQLMNRVNFAQHSGVVVDVCRQHGTWFDMNELQQIVLFIRSGGLEAARAREMDELEAERRRLAATRVSAGKDYDLPVSRNLGMLSLVAGASRGLLDLWLKR